jgi:hypothetical protein
MVLYYIVLLTIICLILHLPHLRTMSTKMKGIGADGVEATFSVNLLLLILGESDHASNLQFSAVVCQDSR